jgi:hypothetical protein
MKKRLIVIGSVETLTTNENWCKLYQSSRIVQHVNEIPPLNSLDNHYHLHPNSNPNPNFDPNPDFNPYPNPDFDFEPCLNPDVDVNIDILNIAMTKISLGRNPNANPYLNTNTHPYLNANPNHNHNHIPNHIPNLTPNHNPYYNPISKYEYNPLDGTNKPNNLDLPCISMNRISSGLTRNATLHAKGTCNSSANGQLEKNEILEKIKKKKEKRNDDKFQGILYDIGE